MEEKRTKKVTWIIILVLLVLSITVAFALLSTQLQINGIAKVEPARWEIKFENLVKVSETGDAREDVAPVITGDTVIGDFQVVLTKPGDSISYTFDAYNAGSIDAELEILTKATTPTFTGLASDPTDKTNDETKVGTNFSYTLKYTTDGADVTPSDLLAKGEKRNMTLTLSYNGSSLPTDDVEISDLGITLLYIQK